jgi:hypothetical protein
MAVRYWLGKVGLYEAATGRQLCLPSLPTPTPLLRFHADVGRLVGFTQERRLGSWQVGEGREYGTLLLPPGANHRDLKAPPVDLDGRLVAAAMAGGVAFWDLDSATEVAFLPLDNASSFVDLEPGTQGPPAL